MCRFKNPSCGFGGILRKTKGLFFFFFLLFTVLPCVVNICKLSVSQEDT